MDVHHEPEYEGPDDTNIAMLMNIPKYNAKNQPVWYPAIVSD
jgi:hypothetical protein